MGRPLWTGYLTFGLVSLPVGLYTAVQEHRVGFRQLQRGTSDRVRNRRVNERTGEEVAFDEVVKGVEVAPGEYVVVEPEELDQLSPTRSKTIEVRGFVDLDQVDPLYYGTPYYLGPREPDQARIYQLLADALQNANRAGIALFALRGREHLAGVHARDGVLHLQLLHFAEEIRDPRTEIDTLPTEPTRATEKELAVARQLIDILGVDWDPTLYHDDSAELVHQLVRDKKAGLELTASRGSAPEATGLDGLLEALQRSIDAAKSGSGPGPSLGGSTPKAAVRSDDLDRLSKTELYRRAAQLQIPRRSAMNRDQLVEALRAVGSPPPRAA